MPRIHTSCPDCLAPTTSEPTRKDYRGLVLETTVSCSECCGWFNRIDEVAERADAAECASREVAAAYDWPEGSRAGARLASHLRGGK